MKHSDGKKILGVVFIVMLGVWIAGCGDDNNSPTSSSEPPTVHAIVCINDIDPSIGASDAIDMNNINTWLNDVSQNTGFPLDRILLTGSGGNLTFETLQSVINSLTIRENDVVIFYYSGHGGNFLTSQWPVMVFLNDQFVTYRSVGDTLKSIGAKLAIVLADCCNNYPWQAKLIPPFRAKASDNWKTLFQKSGYIVASAASPGEFSIATEVGSVFTLQFLLAFSDNVTSNKPSWQTIMANATQTIAIEDNVQHAQVDMNIQ